MRTLVLQVLSLRVSNQSQQQTRKGVQFGRLFLCPHFISVCFFSLSMCDLCLLGFVRKRRFVFLGDGIEPEDLCGEYEEGDSAES